MMTGTPASQDPSDAYGLAKMMNPASVPSSFVRFRDSVMLKITNFKWVPKADSKDKVNAILQPAIRFTKKECLDLPDMLYTYRDVPLTAMQQKYYNMVKQQKAMTAAGATVTAINAAAQVNKLLQISAGAVYADDKEVVEFDITARFNVLKEVIDESTHKVLVFVPYKNSITVLEEKLKKDGYTVDVISGDVSANNRTLIFKQFQEDPDPRIRLIQPAAASHGVTLHAANTVVWWSPHTSNEIYHQANARVHRAGQKNPCLVVRLRGSFVERKRYEALENKSNAMQNLLEMYHAEFD
jgi:SNF2 family DNA or RNA helicase